MMVEAWWLGWPVRVWLAPLVVGAAIGGANIHFAEVRRKDANLRVAHQAVEEMARIAERERIGRDLHDLLGHTLSVIVLKSELAIKLAERDPARAVREIRDVERISRDALAEVRKAVRGYRVRGARSTRSPTPSACSSPPASRREIAVIPANLAARRRPRPRLRAARGRDQRRAPRRRDALLDSPGRATASARRSKCATTAAAAWRPKAAGCRACASGSRQVAGTLERDGDAGHAPGDVAAAAHGSRRDPRPAGRGPGDGARRAERAARHRKRPRGRGRRRDRAPRRSTSRSTHRPDVVRHRHRDARPVRARAGRRAASGAAARRASCILTTFARPGYLRRALDAGASGYLLKDAPSHSLADAIRRVRNGGRAVDPELAERSLVRRGPAHRPRAPGPAPGRRRPVRRRHRRGPAPVGRHRAQLPVEAVGQTRRPQQGRCREDRESQGVAVNPNCGRWTLAPDCSEFPQQPADGTNGTSGSSNPTISPSGRIPPLPVRQFVFPNTFISST